MNTYSQDVTIDNTGKGSLNINSVPAGMIQAIIVRIRPVNFTSTSTPVDVASIGNTGDGDVDGAAGRGQYQSLLNYDPPASFTSGVTRAGTNQPAAAAENKQVGVTPAYRPYVPWSLPIQDLNLQYSGQSIYNARTPESHDGFTRSIFCDDLKTDICGLPLTQTVVGHRRVLNYIMTNADASTNDQVLASDVYNMGDSAMVNHETQCLVIPLMHDGDSIFRKRAFENLPHYSGSTLQLDFHVQKWNYYNSDGTDRRLCNENGTLFTTDESNTYIKQQVVDRYGEGNTWRAEDTPNKCARFPSNRLQHIALARGPRKGHPTISSVGAPNVNHERIVFNNNSDADGAAAYNGVGGTVRVDLTYVVASLFQVTNGVAELQL